MRAHHNPEPNETTRPSGGGGGWLIGALFAAVLGGSGYAWYRYRQQPQLPPPQYAQKTAPPQPIGPRLAKSITQADQLRRIGVETVKPQPKMLVGTQFRSTALQIGAAPVVASARSVLDRLGEFTSPYITMQPRTIQIQTWQDVGDLSNVMQLLFFHAIAPNAAKDAAKDPAAIEPIRLFFARNRFVVPQDSEVYQDQLTVLNYLTPPEGREVIDAAMVVREAAWAGEVATSNDYIKETTDYILFLGCMPKFYPTLTNEARAKVPMVLEDGLLLLFEHTVAKVSNMMAIMAANPQAKGGIEAKILGGVAPLLVAGAKVGAAAVVGGAAAASAAVPVVGWIAAAVGAVAAAIIATIDFIGEINRREEANLKWQEQVQKVAVSVWQGALQRAPLEQSLLGYQLGLISDDPSYKATDSRVRQPWLRNFCLVRGGSFGSPCSERIFPQIPLLVRQIKQGAVVQFGIGRDALRTVSSSLKAWMAPRKQLLMGWQIADIAFEDLPKNLKYLGIK